MILKGMLRTMRAKFLPVPLRKYCSLVCLSFVSLFVGTIKSKVGYSESISRGFVLYLYALL